MLDITNPSSMWKGNNDPTSDPHICPYRPMGIDPKGCRELSGQSVRINRNACCGTFRDRVRFEPCNSSARRCVVCLEKGRTGGKANAVVNIAEGTCEEHAGAGSKESVDLQHPTLFDVRQPLTRPRPSTNASPPQEARTVPEPRIEEPRARRDSVREEPPPREVATSTPAQSVDARASNRAPVKSETSARVLSADTVKVIKSLDTDEHVVLRMTTYGYSDKQIETELRKLTQIVAPNAVEHIRARVYGKLGVDDLPSQRARFTAAGKLYLSFVEYTDTHSTAVIDPDMGSFTVPTTYATRSDSAVTLADSMELDRLWKELVASGGLRAEEDLDVLMRE